MASGGRRRDGPENDHLVLRFASSLEQRAASCKGWEVPCLFVSCLFYRHRLALTDSMAAKVLRLVPRARVGCGSKHKRCGRDAEGKKTIVEQCKVGTLVQYSTSTLLSGLSLHVYKRFRSSKVPKGRIRAPWSQSLGARTWVP